MDYDEDKVDEPVQRGGNRRFVAECDLIFDGHVADGVELLVGIRGEFIFSFVLAPHEMEPPILREGAQFLRGRGVGRIVRAHTSSRCRGEVRRFAVPLHSTRRRDTQVSTERPQSVRETCRGTLRDERRFYAGSGSADTDASEGSSTGPPSPIVSSAHRARTAARHACVSSA